MFCIRHCALKMLWVEEIQYRFAHAYKNICFLYCVYLLFILGLFRNVEFFVLS